MQHSATLDLYEYWITLKGQRYAPQRYEVEPNGIRALLSQTFILETYPVEGSHFRLAGSNICALIGRDLKQSDFLALWDDHGRETLESSLRILRENKACIYASWTGRTARHHEASGEMLLLPLAHDGQISRVLGSFTVFEAPYWQGTFPMVSLKLDDIRVILPTEHGLPLFDDEAQSDLQHDFAGIDFANARSGDADILANAQKGRRVRHLTILDGGQGKG